MCIHLLVSIATCLSVTPAQVTAGTSTQSFGQFLFNVIKYFKGLPANEKEQLFRMAQPAAEPKGKAKAKGKGRARGRGRGRG